MPAVAVADAGGRGAHRGSRGEHERCLFHREDSTGAQDPSSVVAEDPLEAALAALEEEVERDAAAEEAEEESNRERLRHEKVITSVDLVAHFANAVVGTWLYGSALCCSKEL